MIARRRIPPALLLTATAAAQIVPGHYLATHAPPASTGKPSIGWIEPLRGGYRALDNVANQPWTVLRATRAGGDAILLAVRTASRAVVVLAGRVSDRRLASIRLFGSGLQGDVSAMSVLRDRGVLVCTTGGIYRIPPGGGRAARVAPRPPGRVFVDALVEPQQVVVLARSAPRTPAASWIYAAAPGTTRFVAHRIRVPDATAIAISPRTNGYLVGAADGSIYQVDRSRFTTGLWTRTSVGAIQAMGYDTDHRNHAVATRGAIHVLIGTRLATRFRVPAGAIHELHYSAYTSRFTRYGAGCAGSNNAVPVIDASGRPFPGNASFQVRLIGPATGRRAVLVIGPRPTSVDLGRLGMPGCRALVAPFVQLPRLTRAPFTAQPLPVPPIAALAGASLFCQWVVLDPAANAGGLVVSAGGRVTI